MKQLDLFGYEETTTSYTAEADTKRCAMCKEHLPTSSFNEMGISSKGTQYYQGYCRPCHTKRLSNIYHIKKSAPPVPENCACCGVSFSSVSSKNTHMDHCEATEAFRGWLCAPCNLGIGQLGDNIEGVEKALAYLRKHYEKD